MWAPGAYDEVVKWTGGKLSDSQKLIEEAMSSTLFCQSPTSRVYELVGLIRGCTVRKKRLIIVADRLYLITLAVLVSPRVGRGPMRSGICGGVAAGVFNIGISRTGSLPVRPQIKEKTLRSLFEITSDASEHESEGSTPHRRGQRRCTPDSDRNSKCNQPGST